MEKRVIYGVGEQSFRNIRERNMLYVDKTHFIDRIVSEGAQYLFLGRPRRFGKSLFLSTLKCFFEGRRELFKGLYADGMDWDWRPRPVLYLDLNVGMYASADSLDNRLHATIDEWEKQFGVSASNPDPGIRMEILIREVSLKTGEKVVILVDEYDKPLVHSIADEKLFESFRNNLASFYSNFKSSADHIRLVMLTGVSRFSHLSIFSGLNNLLDLTFDDEYSDICGISEDESAKYFTPGIINLADKLHLTTEEIRSRIKEWYDGYRFAGNGKNIYNPFSLLSLMQTKKFSNYWTQSGQATILIEKLRHIDEDLQSFVNTECSVEKLKGLDMKTADPVALFYQTGYLTIKEYDPDFGIARLGIPNKEVTDGFYRYILPLYTNLQQNDADLIIRKFVHDLCDGNADSFMRRLQSFFAGISYRMAVDNERNIHNAMLVLMKLLGLYVEAEYDTSNGRIDLFLATDKFCYIIEIKLDKTAQSAIDQINGKRYDLPFAAGKRRIIKIGVSFSSASRTLADWIIE